MKKSLILIGIIMIPLLIWSQSPPNLEKLVHAAWSNNECLKQAELDVKNQCLEIQNYFIDLFPSVNLSLSFNSTRSRSEVDTIPPTGSYNIGTTQFEPQSNQTEIIMTESESYSKSLSISYPITYSLQRSSSYKIAKLNLKQLELELHNLKQEIAYSILSSYYEIMKQHELLALYQSQESYLNSQKAEVNFKIEAGVSTPGTLYPIDIEIINIKITPSTRKRPRHNSKVKCGQCA